MKLVVKIAALVVAVLTLILFVWPTARWAGVVIMTVIFVATIAAVWLRGKCVPWERCKTCRQWRAMGFEYSHKRIMSGTDRLLDELFGP